MVGRRVVCLMAAAVFASIGAVTVRADEGMPWDPQRITALAAELHAGVSGMRDRVRSTKRDLGSSQASAYYRLLDNLRLVESETRVLHLALESGATRDETLPTYARVAMLRRDCAEEMRRLFLGASVLERISRARDIVQQMDPCYGFDPERPDHDRVLRR